MSVVTDKEGESEEGGGGVGMAPYSSSFMRCLGKNLMGINVMFP